MTPVGLNRAPVCRPAATRATSSALPGLPPSIIDELAEFFNRDIVAMLRVVSATDTVDGAAALVAWRCRFPPEATFELSGLLLSADLDERAFGSPS